MGVVSCVSCSYTAHRVPRVHNFENVANVTGKLEPEGLLTTRRTIQILDTRKCYNTESEM